MAAPGTAALAVLFALVALPQHGTGGGAAAPPPPGFTRHAHFEGIGAVLKMTVAAGPQPGSTHLYAAHTYDTQSLDVVAVDLRTGATEVFTSTTEFGAWAMAVGADGNVYLGTLPEARILRVDWPTRSLVRVSQPAPSEEYVFGLTMGTDKKLYGCTYPNAKLVSYDPATGRGADLGRQSTTEMYARSCAAGRDGFVYLGIGTTHRDLVAYEIATGKHKSILPAGIGRGVGAFDVARGADGNVYGHIGAHAGRAWYRAAGWVPPTATPNNSWPGPQMPDCSQSSCTLADGRKVLYTGRTATVHHPNGSSAIFLTNYSGHAMPIFRIGLGPSRSSIIINNNTNTNNLGSSSNSSSGAAPQPPLLFGNSAEPINFFSASTTSTNWTLIHSELSSGEIYSFLPWRDKLVYAAYSADAPISVYTPGQPWVAAPGQSGRHGVDRVSSSSSSLMQQVPVANPRRVHWSGENAEWRPKAMIEGVDGKVYIGAIGAYGVLGGPLCVFDPAAATPPEPSTNNSRRSRHSSSSSAMASSDDDGDGGDDVVQCHTDLVKDQAPIALVSHPPSGLVIGGTCVKGGGGSRPTQSAAAIFLWSPTQQKLLFSLTPVPANTTIDGAPAGCLAVQALAVGMNGLVYGMCVAGLDKQPPILFAFDVRAPRTMHARMDSLAP
jgi:hypothetical protein